MAPQKHRFPLRRQIVWSMRLFSALASLVMGAALFYLANQYVRTNTLQTAESGLRLMSASIETNFSSAESLINWARSNSTVRQYLTRGQLSGTQMIVAYDAVQEKYLSSPLQPKIIRFFVTDENERFLQFGTTMSFSRALNRTSVKQFLTQGYGMYFAADTLLPSEPVCLVMSWPITSNKGTMHVGTVYLALDTSVIASAASEYPLGSDSELYWEMNNRLYELSDGKLTEIENFLFDVSFTESTAFDTAAWDQRAWIGQTEHNGESCFVVKITLGNRGASLVQVLPQSTFLQQRMVYLWLIIFAVLMIFGLSLILQHWLQWAIARPVESLTARTAAVGAGDFTQDKSIEWDNELGDIGRGINKLAADLDGMIASRVEDERRKQELEYRMLQNEVNPHFIYNTLNSIRWMATIQNAPGIAEMVTAFARLTKSISKGTEKLVPLQDELALLNDYFVIQQYRYGGDIEIEVARIEDERICRDCMIPRFTLQPLAENAIFHGIEPKGGHGSVLLEIRTDPATGDALLIMTDDGVGMSPEQVLHALDEPTEEAERQAKFRHVGLWNVHRRIQYSFGEAYGLEIQSEPCLGTAVTIRLPYQRKEEQQNA